MVRVKQSKTLKTKALLHGFQGIFLALTAILTMVVLAKAGSTDGRSKFVIALCFISIIPLIYLSATPQWQRSRRFANAYVFVALDALFAVLWFSAAVAIGTWNSAGISQGYNEKKKNSNPDDKISKDCSNFAFGPAAKCRVSKASVAPAVILCILFIVTTILSVTILRKGELSEAVGHAPLPGNSYDPTWSHELEQHQYGPAGDQSDDEEYGGKNGYSYNQGGSSGYMDSHVSGNPSSVPHRPSGSDLGGRMGGAGGVPGSSSGVGHSASPGPVGMPDYMGDSSYVGGGESSYPPGKKYGYSS